MGIEPTLLAWEAKVLPLNYTRNVQWGDFHMELSTFPTIRAVIAVVRIDPDGPFAVVSCRHEYQIPKKANQELCP